MSILDVYGRTHELDAQFIDAIATRLEARSGNAKYIAMLHEYLALLDLAKAKDVLVLGCGTGVEVRQLLGRSEFRGKVTATDISADLLQRGRQLAAHEDFANRIDWQVQDAQNVTLPDGGFDVVIAHTLVSHVPRPVEVVREAARLVRGSGTVAVFDGDYATMTFGADREMDEKIISAVIANPRVMRAMPQLFRHVGLELIDSRGWLMTEIGRADFFVAALNSFSILVPKTGVATAEDMQDFVARQMKASEDGTFFAGYNFYAMIGKGANAS
ncbi:methyltransferase domain-containing protein [Paraburkholderia sp. MMS20-SJTN17]|uniref:Methyltransferase domain-containing protein n=1 Tax=Paraburkholderia translucens TaxID=2886945 RepID=A0ABS8K833_9BURK|nr:methyltransferase domain-containing protein [Paraburkholderia sp. MMS20-SJTN17]MCC8400903.1 methyltransferase domain-containing protein [Paraburkholderia sp. MMS20-SJTN17]